MKTTYIVLLRMEGETDYTIVRLYDTLKEADAFADKIEDKLMATGCRGEVTIATNDLCSEEHSLSILDGDY